MSARVVLMEHVVFRELPFCGVLLDARTSRVYRLSQSATAMLRHALNGIEAPGPHEPVIRSGSTASAAERERLVANLASAGLVRVPSPRRLGEETRDAA